MVDIAQPLPFGAFLFQLHPVKDSKMHIEANLGYFPVDNGVKLPEYLVRMTQREAIALGAKTFNIGEKLDVNAMAMGVQSKKDSTQ